MDNFFLGKSAYFFSMSDLLSFTCNESIMLNFFLIELVGDELESIPALGETLGDVFGELVLEVDEDTLGETGIYLGEDELDLTPSLLDEDEETSLALSLGI